MNENKKMKKEKKNLPINGDWGLTLYPKKKQKRNP